MRVVDRVVVHQSLSTLALLSGGCGRLIKSAQELPERRTRTTEGVQIDKVFLGTALGFAFTQSATVILLMFGSIALGMSAPYFLLSAQPAWLKFLPKPGPWMVRVKQLMGFLLIATLLFLLSVLGAQRGVASLIWTCAFLLVLSVACWMKGAFITPVASALTRFLVLVLMLVLVIGSGIYFIGDKFQSAAAV